MTRIFGILIAVLFLSVGHTASAQYSRELLKSAQEGNSASQTLLGDAYYTGEGIEQNHAEAVKWWRLSAEQGMHWAHYSLGYVYFKGHGVIQDFVYAHMWLNISASLGTRDAAKMRELVADQMTPEQIGEAQKLARECVRKKYKDC